MAPAAGRPALRRTCGSGPRRGEHRAEEHGEAHEKNALVAEATALEGAGTSGVLGAGPSPLSYRCVSPAEGSQHRLRRQSRRTLDEGTAVSGGVNAPAAGQRAARCGPPGRPSRSATRRESETRCRAVQRRRDREARGRGGERFRRGPADGGAQRLGRVERAAGRLVEPGGRGLEQRGERVGETVRGCVGRRGEQALHVDGRDQPAQIDRRDRAGRLDRSQAAQIDRRGGTGQIRDRRQALLAGRRDAAGEVSGRCRCAAEAVDRISHDGGGRELIVAAIERSECVYVVCNPLCSGNLDPRKGGGVSAAAAVPHGAGQRLRGALDHRDGGLRCGGRGRRRRGGCLDRLHYLVHGLLDRRRLRGDGDRRGWGRWGLRSRRRSLGGGGRLLDCRSGRSRLGDGRSGSGRLLDRRSGRGRSLERRSGRCGRLGRWGGRRSGGPRGGGRGHRRLRDGGSGATFATTAEAGFGSAPATPTSAVPVAGTAAEAISAIAADRRNLRLAAPPARKAPTSALYRGCARR